MRQLGNTFVFSLLAASLAAQSEYNQEQNDKLMIKYQVHRKLAAVPLKIGSINPHLRAQYKPNDDGDYIRGQYSWELYILEFPKKRGAPAKPKEATDGGTTTAGGTDASEAIAEHLAAADFREWVTEKDDSIKDRTFQEKGKSEKAKGKRPAFSYWEYSDVDDRFGFWYRCAAVYDFEDKEIALVVNIPAIGKPKPKDNWLKWANRMITSLEILDPSDVQTSNEPDEDRDTFANTPERQKELDKAKANIANLKHWDYFTMPNYIVLYSWDPEKPTKRRESYKYARTMVEGLEQCRELYIQDYPPHDKMQQPYSVLRICDNYDEFMKYGNTPPGVVGWFNPGSKELVMFDDKTNLVGGDKDAKATCFHEGWHQYSNSYFGDNVELHRWFDEGSGDFYGAHTKKSKWSYESDKGRYQSIRTQVARGNFIPLREIVSWNKDKFYGPRAPDHYAQGYSLIDFLRRGPDKLGKRFDDSWKNILETYRKTMLETKNQKTAVEKAFEGVDFDALESAWIDWVKKYMK